MCRIDELFSSHSLEEKSEPTERFAQALDEYGASGDFRELLETHFSSSWRSELGNIEKVETALKSAKDVEGLPAKISSFVTTIAGSHTGGWFQYGFHNEYFLQMDQEKYPSRHAFAQDVANEAFSDSPYGFYQCFKGAINVRFEVFVLRVAPAYYGDDFHVTSLLVEDKELEAISEKERHDLLMPVFNHMVQLDCTFVENLRKLFSCEVHSSDPTRETLQFSRSFDFLGAWVEADALSREYSVTRDLLVSIVNDNNIFRPIYDIYGQKSGYLSEDCPEDEWQVFKRWANKWLEGKRHELSKAWCCNVNLEGLSESEFDIWAQQAYDSYLPLSDGLSKERAESLIAWGIKQDLENILGRNDKGYGFLDDCEYSHRWYISAYRDLWWNKLTDSLEALPYEERLFVLKRRFGSPVKVPASLLPPYISLPQQFFKKDETYGPDCASYIFKIEQESDDSWDSLLRSLSVEESFPKALYPLWTLAVCHRFGLVEELASCADKSLGIVRGDVSAGTVKVNAEDVGRLLEMLEYFDPEKAMRHRLLLLRNSQQPCTTENLDHDRNSFCRMTMSEILNKISVAHFRHESRCHFLSGDEWLNEELELVASVRTWVAKYCLSRLQLRKGEKAGSVSYGHEQVVESSPIWRKAYLQALAELGIDLTGKVHKTVYFTRKFDPEEDVRKVAQICYKAVRREHNKSESAADIRRGLTAAYWWLLLAQRHALGANINQEEAVKTRRRLLRRP